MSAIAAVVLAAGAGTRMNSSKPKVLHEIGGRPMVSHLLDTVNQLGTERVVVVTAPNMDAVQRQVAPATIAIQHQAKGTGHAVLSSLDALDGFEGDVLVLFGDCPLIKLETLRAMVEKRREQSAAVAVLGFEPEDAAEYGRLVTNTAGELEAIVEFADADAKTRAIGICNSGVMVFDGSKLASLIGAITDNNSKGEFYLTDVVEIANSQGLTCTYVIGDELELLGINNRVQLSQAEQVVQSQWRQQVMEGGATLIDPASVWLSYDTKIGQDVVIEPNVFIGTNVIIRDNVRVKAHSHLEGTTIGERAQIGPFARLRPGANLASDVRVGNFVEIKKSMIETGAKISHLSYIGDAEIGSEANIGAGTITCNYDGFDKFATKIGAGSFIGSNTALVAPVTVGEGAIVGAGSTITRNVEADALAIERGDENQKPGWAERFRSLKKKIRK
ncbi:bifunctional UDP-N-acetylglucosamine diphosphorylase/glucosamine-1-phosphate N-acetyltransferase GlmU [Sneathiella marina]|uniref:Bifunctional protein GlmU n=1 Tax=Sneathiella marina TaxID=2950108 RepID=A0ABY4W877_9PROT|nr:bifunctional UDP-N-acetylglucosamine diphosphorylase/glucosamine-1-phosphate N-acetyltransferase GlmU [Sneathiella marina]USG63232.1 bifunctional UDP-N-acetylglucosamine diphosphorylase/glucosamine-1-phosphate N-acetyltransferase GlmU [Sneathiella marina]